MEAILEAPGRRLVIVIRTEPEGLDMPDLLLYLP
jgi:hypothetical protein